MTAITLTEPARRRLIDLAARRWAQLSVQLAGADCESNAPWPLSWYTNHETARRSGKAYWAEAKTKRRAAIQKYQGERAELRAAILALSGLDDLPEPNPAAFTRMAPIIANDPRPEYSREYLHYQPGKAKEEQARLAALICKPPRDPDVGFGPVFDRLASQ